MEQIAFNVKALAKTKNMNIEELANATGINANHLKNVSAKVTKMTLEDAKKLSNFTGVPISKITEE